MKYQPFRRDCKDCGIEYKPKTKWQSYCDDCLIKRRGMNWWIGRRLKHSEMKLKSVTLK